MDAVAIVHPSKKVQHGLLIAGGFILLVLVSIQYIAKINSSERDTRSAIQRWHEQIRSLGTDAETWRSFNYPNPPVMAIILWPLAQLPPIVCSLVWFYLKVLMAIAAVAIAFRMVETPDRPFPLWGKALAMLLALRPVVGDLSHGNVNLFILILVMTALDLFMRNRQTASGFFLALAIACKVTPALFVPYFLWKRAWRATAACAGGLVVFLWLIPGLLLGFDKNADYFGTWLDQMVLPYVLENQVTTEHHNQSLPGLLHRLTTAKPSFSTHVDGSQTAVDFHNFLTLDTQTVQWILKGLGLIFMVLVVLSCRTPMNHPARWRLAAEFSIVCLGMLLFSERTWKHHCVVLLLPFTVVCYYLSALRSGVSLRVYLAATLAVALILMTSTSTGVFNGHDQLGKLAQVYGAYVWAYLVLLVALLVLLWRKDAASAGNQASISVTTAASCTSGIGRPRRSVSMVSESMPSR